MITTILQFSLMMLDISTTKVQHSIYENGKFRNPWPGWSKPNLRQLFRYVFLDKDRSDIPTENELNKTLPIQKPQFNYQPTDDGVKITWLGHSTTLVHFDNVTVLTDPIFSQRASPSQLFGPKRYRNCPCNVSELPPVDAVVISHNHYDHLDIDSVNSLNSRFGDKLKWFVPMGLANWMEANDIKNVVELNWWESSCIANKSNVAFVFTPAQHWCKRTLADDNQVLWGSWTLIGPKHRFFFAGDAGYCNAFKQIGDVYGPFDVAAIPIGAYEPRWFMRPHHVDPEEAVKIHLDIRSNANVAIHWGTFSLGHEHYLDPPKKLKEALKFFKLPEEVFTTLSHGETRQFSPS